MSQRKTELCSPIVKISLQMFSTIAVLLVLLTLCDLPSTAAIDYQIQDGSKHYQITSNATDLVDVLDEAHISYSNTDLISAEPQQDAVSVSITHRHLVTVTCDGISTSVLAEEGSTPADILNHLNISLNEYDEVSVPLDEELPHETPITVYRATVSYTSSTDVLPYKELREADPDMDQGTEALTTKGVDGSCTTHYRVIQLEGQEEPRYQVIDTNTVLPINQVTHYGTKVHLERPSGYSTTSEYITNIDNEQMTFTTSRGNTYSFSEQLVLNATAYTARPGAICSTGRLARVGVVAVDPKYIPYGTELFIMSEDGSFVYGLAVAGDCGGAIDDNDVDLYMTSHSTCINFGRRNLVAYVVDKEV